MRAGVMVEDDQSHATRVPTATAAEHVDDPAAAASVLAHVVHGACGRQAEQAEWVSEGVEAGAAGKVRYELRCVHAPSISKDSRH